MPYEPEDAAGWTSLPAVNSDDEQDAVSDSIGPLHAGNEPYVYRSEVFTGQQQLTLVSQPEKVRSKLVLLSLGAWLHTTPTLQGLSFQIWPSALSLSRYAEVQCQEPGDYWKVRFAGLS